MTRYALLAAAAVALSTASPASAQTKGGVTFSDALGIAQAQVPGGILIKGRAENNKVAGQVFGFYFWVDGKMREVEITTAGEVYKDSNNTPDPISRDVATLISAKGARAKLPDGRLAELAASALNGAPVTSVAFVRQGDQLLAQFGAVTLDASTGRVVSPPPK
jgi:hypothetical protein